MPMPFPADSMEEESETPLYVLTNKARLYGASCILYPNLLDSIADKLTCDFYLIPSSIHEFLILPVLPGTCIQDLNAMIHEVNSTQVEEEEILSDPLQNWTRRNSAPCHVLRYPATRSGSHGIPDMHKEDCHAFHEHYNWKK